MKKLVNDLTPFGALLAAATAHFDWRIAAPILIITAITYFLTYTE